MLNKSTKKYGSIRRADTIFYIAIIAVPLINFFFLQFYQSYLFTFIFSVQKYDYSMARYAFTSDVFYNFRNFFNTLSSDPRWGAAFGVTFKGYLIGWLTNTPIGLIVPYYIFKKFAGYKVFKFILMMPSMISSMVWTMVFLKFAESGFVEMFGLQIGPFSNPDTQFAAMTIRGIWTSAASSMLLYTGILSGISDSVLDAARVDGAGPFREFIHICIPRLWPVWSIGIFTGFGTLFTGYSSVLELFGYDAGPQVATVGYLMFTSVMRGGNFDSYGFNAAGSIILTFSVLPVVLIGKAVVERVGPSEDERKPIKFFFPKRRKSR